MGKMNVFATVDDLWLCAVNKCLEEGKQQSSRHGEMNEVISWSATLTDIDNAWLCNRTRALNPSYGCAEYLHLMARSDGLDMMQHYAPNYGQYATNSNLPWAYGYRLWLNHAEADQLREVVYLLKDEPASRCAVATVWKPSDLTTRNQVVPCTIAWQFLLRDGLLHMSVAVRSQDVWLGMPYDIFVATMVQRIIAGELGVNAGAYHHHIIGSMHLYHKHAPRAALALTEFPPTSLPLNFTPPITEVHSDAAILIERLIRGRKLLDYDAVCKVHAYTQAGWVHEQILACCARESNVSLPCSSPALKFALGGYGANY